MIVLFEALIKLHYNNGAAGFFVDVIMTWIQKEMESFYEKN